MVLNKASFASLILYRFTSQYITKDKTSECTNVLPAENVHTLQPACTCSMQPTMRPKVCKFVPAAHPGRLP